MNFYYPIFDSLGVSPITLKDIYNPDHVIFGLNHSRKKIRRMKGGKR